METKSIHLAEEYYNLLGEKNVEAIEKYFHPEVEFYGPFAALKGKEAVFNATCNYMNTIESLKIRATFGAGSEVALIYDVDIPGIKNDFPAAVYLKFQDEMIVRYEVFYDGSRFLEKKDEIFS